MTSAPAQTGDLEALIRLTESMRTAFPDYEETMYRDMFRRNISRQSVLCCMNSEGFLSGACVYSPTHGAIGFLAVRPETRRMGTGTTLMRAAIASLGHTRPIYLHALHRDDRPGSILHNFYSSLGFSPCAKEIIGNRTYRRWELPSTRP